MSKELVINDLQKLYKAFELYIKSIDKISKYKDLKDYDLEVLDAFFIRFERIVELILSKLSKSIEIYETWTSDFTLRDRLNLFEKLWLISSTEKWLDMRSLRNKIVHDYIENLASDLIFIIQNHYDDEIKNTLKILREYESKL